MQNAENFIYKRDLFRKHSNIQISGKTFVILKKNNVRGFLRLFVKKFSYTLNPTFDFN